MAVSWLRAGYRAGRLTIETASRPSRRRRLTEGRWRMCLETCLMLGLTDVPPGLCDMDPSEQSLTER